MTVMDCLTEVIGSGHVETSQKNITTKSKNAKKELNIGKWNVQTMLELGKLCLLVKELERSKMNITGLCEVRWSGQGLFLSMQFYIVEMKKVAQEE